MFLLVKILADPPIIVDPPAPEIPTVPVNALETVFAWLFWFITTVFNIQLLSLFGFAFTVGDLLCACFVLGIVIWFLKWLAGLL